MHSRVFLAFCITLLAQLAVPQSIDPKSVDPALRSKWCLDQKSSCPLICLQLPGASGTPEYNTCDSNTLSYSCVCSNGQTPNASEYSQTIPFYECQTSADQCVAACPSNDSNCQTSCRTAHPCGAQNPTRINVTSTSTSMSATGTGSEAAATSGGSSDSSKTTGKNTFTGFGGTAATATGSSSSTGGAQALALDLGRAYGLFMVLLSITGGFAFML